MSCRSTRLELLSYVHGELTPERQDLVIQHLAACPLCSVYVDQLRVESGQLTGYMMVDAPQGLQDRIMHRIAQGAQARPLISTPAPLRALRFVVLAAASLAMAFSGLRVLSPQAYALIVNNAAQLGSRINGLLSQHVTVWPSLVRAFSAVSSLVGL